MFARLMQLEDRVKCLEEQFRNLTQPLTAQQKNSATAELNALFVAHGIADNVDKKK